MYLYEDKMFPNQEFNSSLYTDKISYLKSLYSFLIDNDKEIKKNHDSFKFKKHEKVPFEEMSTPPLQVGFLKFLLNIIKGKTILEIGTFLGSTSMHLASHIGKSAEIVSIEKFSEFAFLANENVKLNNLTENIKIIQGDAIDIIPKQKNNFFDLIYVDGDKGNYLKLTKLAEEKLSSKGFILVDDIFFHGDALNKNPSTEKGRGCKETIDYYSKSDKFYKYILPLNNGILLLKRKDNV